tara:strand:- start:1000 stop:1497 length:498 start_codon:yes stop_codon:yes gene_type:complete
MNQLTSELMKFKYPKTYSRKNVLQEGDRCYEGFVLGKVWSWAHKDVKETGHHLRDNNNNHQDKFQRIKELSHEIADEFGCEFTTIQFNKNYQCAKHIDGKNAGISHIIGLGDYEGGELLIYYDGPDKEPTSVDIKNQFYSFDGSEYYHETSPYTGERHSIVFFSL